MISVSGLKLHDDRTDLWQLMHNFYGKRDFLYFYHSIKFELETAFPSTKLYLYSYEKNGSTYWYAYKVNKVVNASKQDSRDHTLVAVEGCFDKDDFLEGFHYYVHHVNLFDGESAKLIVADKFFTDAIGLYLDENVPTFSRQEFCSVQFYTTAKQRKALDAMIVPDPPCGYTMDEARHKDAEIITETWNYSEPKDLEQTKSKLSHFPSVCVRWNNSPVGFEMVDHCGHLCHQFVLEAHRQKGIGRVVELAIVQKSVRRGILPYKTVRTFNKNVIDWSTRTKYWTRATNADGTDIIVVDMNLIPKTNMK